MSQPHFGLSVRVKPTLPKVGTWSPQGLPKAQSSSSGVKTPRIGVFLVSLKNSWNVDVQNGLAWAIWTYAAQVMGKRRPGIKLAVWLPTTKSRESTSSWHPLRECDMALKSSRKELQLWFRPRSNQSWQSGDMSSQSPGTPTRDSFGTPPWESQEKEPFRCSLGRKLQSILYGGRWWLPPSPGHGESSVSKCPWLVPWMLTNPLMVGFGCRFKQDNLVPLPSLISRLLAHPSTRF
jgi:hypothetical protein